MKKKYNVGDKLGPYQLEFLEETYVTSYNHRYGLFRCQCGQVFEAKVHNIVQGMTQRCPECRRKIRQGKNNINFKNLLGKRYGKLTVVEYLGAKQVGETKEGKKLTNSLWKCQCDCGNYVERTCNVLENNGIGACPQCRITSIGEEKIKDILNTLKINYLCQYTFSDCKDKFMLPFDFYLPKYNLLIEYDGLGHYQSSQYKSSWRTEEAVLKTQNHDNIKNQYCLDNNIKLIRIPYYDYNKIDTNYLMLLITA